MYVGRLTGEMKVPTVDMPSWVEVRNTILAMDQSGNNQIFLMSTDPQKWPFMMIGGGANSDTGLLVYICQFTDFGDVDPDGKATSFREYFLQNLAVFEEEDVDLVEIVISNSSETIEPDLAVDHDMVLSAAEYFFEHGEMNPDLDWRLYNEYP